MDAEKNEAGNQISTGGPAQIQTTVAGQPTVSPPHPSEIATADGGSPGTLAPADTQRQVGRPLPSRQRKAPVRKKRGLWGWLVLLVVLLVAAGVGYYFWQSNQGPTGFQGIAIPAFRAPVALSVSASGQIAAKADLALTFGSAGTVTEINKHQGQTVKQGEVLAKIDDSTLKNTVATSLAQLNSAKANLDKVKTGSTPAQIQQQQDAVKQAELKYQETANGNALASDIANAQAQLAAAQAKYQQDAQGGTAAQKAQAASSISSAQAGLQSAQAKLQQDQEGGTPAQKAQAQSAVSSAQSALESAQAKYQLTLAGPDAATVAAAQATYDQANASLEKTKSQLASAVQSASSSKQQALDALNNAQDSYNNVYYANRNADGTLKSNLTSVQTGAETNALRALQDAQAKYDQANSAYNDSVVQQTQGITSAQAQVNSAKAALDKTKAGPTQADVAAAKATVDQAQSSLQQAQASLAALAPTGSQLASDQASIAQAQASIQSANASQAALAPTSSQLASDQASISAAQANLDKLTTGGTPNDIAISKSQLDSAQAALADLQAGAKPDDIAVAQASVDVAQASYDNAVLNLKNATITAPFDGLIANDNNIQVGQQVTASASIFQLVDSSSLHVDVNVGETDVSKIQLNMPVAVNLDAIPNESFTGKVTFISPKATVTNNVVIYVVTVTLDPQGQNSLLTKYGSVLSSLIGNRGQANGTGTTRAGGQANGTPGAGGSASVGGQTNGTPGAGGATGGFAGGATGGQRTGGGFAAFGGASGGASICGWTPSFNRSGNQVQPKVGESANVTVCLDLQVPSQNQVSVISRAIKTKTVSVTQNGQTRNQQVKYVTILDDKATNKTHDVEVQTGLVGDTFTLITDGVVKQGDQIVISTTGARTTGGATGNNANPLTGGGGAGGGGARGGRGG